MSTAFREKALPSLPPGEFGANSLGLDADGSTTPTKTKAWKGKQPMRPLLPPPSHSIPLSQPSPSRTEFLEPQRGYTSYTNLSPSPSPSKSSWATSRTSTYANSQQGSSSTLSSIGQTLTPPASPSTITAASIRSMTTPTKATFAPPAPSPLSTTDENGRRGSEPGLNRQKSGFAALGKKRSSGQLLAGLGKGLGRMGSVVRRTASDSSALLSSQAPESPGGSLGRGRLGWRSKAKRDNSLQEVHEGHEAPEAIDKGNSEMDLGDEGIGLPFNVEHDLHVSPDLDDLPPAWLETLKQQGLSEQDLMLITAARNRQAESSRNASKITDTCLHRLSQSSPAISESLEHGSSLGIERAPTLKKFSFEPGPAPSPAESPDPLDTGGSIVAEPFSFYTSLNETDMSLATRDQISIHEEEEEDDKPLAMLRPKTKTKKKDKRLSDQLRHFSQLKLGDDESWSASILGAFAEEPSEELYEALKTGSTAWTVQDQNGPFTPVTPTSAEATKGAYMATQGAHVSDTPSTFIASPISPLVPSPLACSHLFQSLRTPEKDLYSHVTPATTPTRSPGIKRLPSPPKPLGPRPPPRSPVPTQASPGPSIPSSHSSRFQSPSTPQHREGHYPGHKISQSSFEIGIVTPSTSYPARDTSSAASAASGHEETDYEEFDQSSDLDLVEAMVADRYPESLASDRVKEYRIDNESPRYLSPAPEKGHPFLPRQSSPLASDSREVSRVEEELRDHQQYNGPAILSPVPQRVGMRSHLDGKPRSQRCSLPASASSSVLLSPSPSSDPLPLPSTWNHHERHHEQYETKHDNDHYDHHDRHDHDDHHGKYDDRPLSHVDRLVKDSHHDQGVDTRHHSRTSMFSYVSSEGSNLHASVHEATVQLAYTKLLSGFRSPIERALSVRRQSGQSGDQSSSHRGSISSRRAQGFRDSTFTRDLRDSTIPRDARDSKHSSNSRESHAPYPPEGVEEGTETGSDAGCSALDALDEAARKIAGHSYDGRGLHSGFLSPQRYSPGNLSMFEDADEEELATPRKGRV